MEIKFLILLLFVFVPGFAFSIAFIGSSWIGKLAVGITGFVCFIVSLTLAVIIKKRFCLKKEVEPSLPQNVQVLFNPIIILENEENSQSGPIYESNYSNYAGNLHLLGVHRFIGLPTSKVLENGEKEETEEITVQMKFD
ncbi:uncharacterized protein LOC136074952 [Hydra vulgaris]|uniref:Uncharacterized protein LOC136074952 n=1 Tax=Hydra vulgaris TaxID=6087 RepID=A0ABM4B322_HYDVU